MSHEGVAMSCAPDTGRERESPVQQPSPAAEALHVTGPVSKSAWTRYAVAVVVASTIAVLRVLGYLPDFAPAYGLIYPVSFLVAIWGGFGPGLLCVLLAAIPVELLAVEPLYVVKLDWYAFFRFFAPTTCIAISGLVATALHASRRRAQAQAEAARVAEERFRLMAEACPDVVWRYRLIEPRGFEYVSPSIATVSGYTPQEHYRDPQLSAGIVYPADRELFAAYWKDPAAFETPFVLRFIRKDGGIIWMEQHNVCIRDERGQIVAVQGLARDVSARKRAEDSLRESEARFSTLASASLEGIAISEHGRILDANQRYADLYGCTVSEMIGTEIATLVAPEDMQRVAEMLMGHVEGWGEYLNVRKDGTVFPIEASSRILEHNGRKLRITSVRDISERKAAEERLRHSEESFRIAADASGAMVYEVDLLADCIIRTHGLEQLLGYPEEVSEPRDREWWYELTHPEDRRAAIEASLPATTQGRDFQCTYRVRHQQGHYIIVEDTGRVLCDASGRPSRIIGGVVDITGRKAAEEALAESERRYRQLIESTHEGVWLIDSVGVTTYVNPQMAEMLGYTPEEMWGRPCHAFLFEEDLEAAQGRLARSYGGQLEQGEIRCRTKQGQEVWFLVNPSLVKDRDGRCVGLLGMFADITERRNAMEAMKRANAAKDRFIAILSHELRNPLQPALMSASALEHDDTVPLELRSELGLIRRNLELEVRLIDDLLDLNRIALRKLKLTKRVVDVHAKLLNSLDICRADAGAKRIDLLTDLGALDVHVSADAGRLQQVFWNVLKNAIKFTPPGGRIELRTSNPEPGRLRVFVADTGIGIDPEVLPRLFNVFEQGPEEVTQEYGGLGLGLALSRELVEMHEGRISAESAGRDLGTVITIELPTVAEEPGAPEFSGAECGNGGCRLRILLVEDHATSAQVTARLLRRDGHAVEVRGDFQSGVRLAMEKDFDLIISDLGLPDGNGRELMRCVRERRPGQKGIALSGYGMPADVEESRAAGFAEHLTKPVDIQTLRLAVQRVMAVDAGDPSAASCG